MIQTQNLEKVYTSLEESKTTWPLYNKIHDPGKQNVLKKSKGLKFVKLSQEIRETHLAIAAVTFFWPPGHINYIIQL